MAVALLRFNFVYGDLIRWLQGPYTNSHWDWDDVFTSLEHVTSTTAKHGHPHVDFDRAYRDGHSHANRHVVLYAFPRSEEEEGAEEEGEGAEVRLGISVGRKVGGAVERNKVKRKVREAFWMLAEMLPPGHDFVLVARAGIPDLIENDGIEGLRGSIAELLDRARADEG